MRCCRKDCPGSPWLDACLSSDRLANSALRVQATAIATGQAVGAMAASTGTDLRDLDLSTVCRMLREHGAIVPGWV